MYTEILSICIALSYNFTVKSWAIFNKSQNVEKKTASEQASRHDTKFFTRFAAKVIAMIILKQLK